MGINICPPPPQESLNPKSWVHPGFGSVEVRCSGRVIHYDVHGDGHHGPATAGGLAQRFVKNNRKKYELLIDGPLASYDYKWSHSKKVWLLTKQRDGFA